MILPGGISVYCILITYISRDKLCSTLSKMLNWLMHLSKEADPVTVHTIMRSRCGFTFKAKKLLGINVL